MSTLLCYWWQKLLLYLPKLVPNTGECLNMRLFFYVNRSFPTKNRQYLIQTLFYLRGVGWLYNTVYVKWYNFSYINNPNYLSFQNEFVLFLILMISVLFITKHFFYNCSSKKFFILQKFINFTFEVLLIFK